MLQFVQRLNLSRVAALNWRKGIVNYEESDRVLITGASGFIGSAIVRTFLERRFHSPGSRSLLQSARELRGLAG